MISFSSLSYADGKNIQMLPPLDFNGLSCDNKDSTGGGLLYWDGSNPIRCVPSSSGNGSGFVGIGTSSPVDKLTVWGSDMDTQVRIVNSTSTTWRWPAVWISNYNGGYGGGSPAINMHASRGSAAAPMAIKNGDRLGIIDFAGQYDSARYGWSANIAVTAEGDFANMNYPSRMTFYTGSATIGGAERMRIDSLGRVGIGTPSPASKLQIVQPGGLPEADPARVNPLAVDLATEALIVAKDYNGGGGGVPAAEIYATDAGVDKTGIQVALKGDDGFGSGYPLVVLANGSTVAYVDYYGQMKAAAYYHGSDLRLKEDVTPVKNPLDIIGGLRGVAFTWKKDGRPAAGVIAQDVEKVMPSAVKADADGYLSVDYDQLMAPMIEAIKLQQADLRRQDLEIRRQEAESAALRKEFESYKAAHP